MRDFVLVGWCLAAIGVADARAMAADVTATSTTTAEGYKHWSVGISAANEIYDLLATCAEKSEGMYWDGSKYTAFTGTELRCDRSYTWQARQVLYTCYFGKVGGKRVPLAPTSPLDSPGEVIASYDGDLTTSAISKDRLRLKIEGDVSRWFFSTDDDFICQNTGKDQEATCLIDLEACGTFVRAASIGFEG